MPVTQLHSHAWDHGVQSGCVVLQGIAGAVMRGSREVFGFPTLLHFLCALGVAGELHRAAE